MNDEIYLNMQKHDINLAKYATKDEDALYLKENKNDLRTPYFHDIDRIIYSLSYVRYMNKTQVFSQKENDHIQTRMIHVQYVSKIARTIGRALGLNEDLIEAAALGHDLGHPPFGHEGERILNKISLELGEGYFLHNVNSVRILTSVENHGEGQNISLQVLDAIMCHNGEIVSNEYYTKPKTIESFKEEYAACYQNPEISKYLRPMTLEGCVVRISDIIAYIGRDIEDGIRKGLVSFAEIPHDITHVLGDTNSKIINTIICDIIKNSLNKSYLMLSDEVFNATLKLKNFNYEHIYQKSLSLKEKELLEKKFRFLINTFLNDLKNNNENSVIFKSYLNNMSPSYIKNNTQERIVLDYVSGMTDDYFNEQFTKLNIKEENKEIITK